MNRAQKRLSLGLSIRKGAVVTKTSDVKPVYPNGNNFNSSRHIKSAFVAPAAPTESSITTSMREFGRDEAARSRSVSTASSSCSSRAESAVQHPLHALTQLMLSYENSSESSASDSEDDGNVKASLVGASTPSKTGVRFEETLKLNEREDWIPKQQAKETGERADLPPSSRQGKLGNLDIQEISCSKNNEQQFTALREKSTIPLDQSIAPHEQSMAPQEESIAPHEQSMAPKEQSIAPQEESKAPHEQSMAPKEQSLAPQKQSITPHDQSVEQQNQSIEPPEQSIAPPEQSLEQQNQSIAPQKQSIAPHDQSLEQKQQSVEPHERSIAPQEQSQLQAQPVIPQKQSASPQEEKKFGNLSEQDSLPSVNELQQNESNESLQDIPAVTDDATEVHFIGAQLCDHQMEMQLQLSHSLASGKEDTSGENTTPEEQLEAVVPHRGEGGGVSGAQVCDQQTEKTSLFPASATLGKDNVMEENAAAPSIAVELCEVHVGEALPSSTLEAPGDEGDGVRGASMAEFLDGANECDGTSSNHGDGVREASMAESLDGANGCAGTSSNHGRQTSQVGKACDESCAEQLPSDDITSVQRSTDAEDEQDSNRSSPCLHTHDAHSSGRIDSDDDDALSLGCDDEDLMESLDESQKDDLTSPSRSDRQIQKESITPELAEKSTRIAIVEKRGEALSVTVSRKTLTCPDLARQSTSEHGTQTQAGRTTFTSTLDKSSTPSSSSQRSSESGREAHTQESTKPPLSVIRQSASYRDDSNRVAGSSRFTGSSNYARSGDVVNTYNRPSSSRGPSSNLPTSLALRQRQPIYQRLGAPNRSPSPVVELQQLIRNGPAIQSASLLLKLQQHQQEEQQRRRLLQLPPALRQRLGVQPPNAPGMTASPELSLMLKRQQVMMETIVQLSLKQRESNVAMDKQREVIGRYQHALLVSSKKAEALRLRHTDEIGEGVLRPPAAHSPSMDASRRLGRQQPFRRPGDSSEGEDFPPPKRTRFASTWQEGERRSHSGSPESPDGPFPPRTVDRRELGGRESLARAGAGDPGLEYGHRHVCPREDLFHEDRRDLPEFCGEPRHLEDGCDYREMEYRERSVRRDQLGRGRACTPEEECDRRVYMTRPKEIVSGSRNSPHVSSVQDEPYHGYDPPGHDMYMTDRKNINRREMTRSPSPRMCSPKVPCELDGDCRVDMRSPPMHPRGCPLQPKTSPPGHPLVGTPEKGMCRGQREFPPEYPPSEPCEMPNRARDFGWEMEPDPPDRHLYSQRDHHIYEGRGLRSRFIPDGDIPPVPQDRRSPCCHQMGGPPIRPHNAPSAPMQPHTPPLAPIRPHSPPFHEGRGPRPPHIPGEHIPPVPEDRWSPCCHQMGEPHPPPHTPIRLHTSPPFTPLRPVARQPLPHHMAPPRFRGPHPPFPVQQRMTIAHFESRMPSGEDQTGPPWRNGHLDEAWGAVYESEWDESYHGSESEEWRFHSY